MIKNHNIVFIGGGTGLSNILEGAKRHPWNISAIVAMTDDGLSTGRIRRDFNTLPPGDLRKCLIALSDDKTLREVFSYRFQRSKGLAKHSLGNLIILALEKTTGNYDLAIKKASEILNTKGVVIPSTLENIKLAGKLKNGKKVVGERKLFLEGVKSAIEKVWLVPKKAKSNNEAVQVIKNADVIVIGPGSLYTSIIPNLLLKNITRAIIKNKKAEKIYVCNASTERGETQGFDVNDHIREIQKYSDKNIFNKCLVNSKIISRSDKEYKIGEVKNISTTKDYILGCEIIKKDLVNDANPLYHDKNKVISLIWKIVNEKK